MESCVDAAVLQCLIPVATPDSQSTLPCCRPLHARGPSQREAVEEVVWMDSDQVEGCGSGHGGCLFEVMHCQSLLGGV